MTVDQFIADLENFYGAYTNQYLKKTVIAYMQKDHNPSKYREISRAIKYYHFAYRGTPCIASIEKALKEARYEKGLNVTSLNPTDTTRYDYRKEAEENPEEYKRVGSLMKDLAKKNKGG